MNDTGSRPLMTADEFPLRQPRPTPRHNLPLLALGTLLFGVTAIAYAWFTSFSYFAFYDDEGFMMISVQGFLQEHRLYDEVLTYYGPIYYFYEWFIHSFLHLPLTHNFTTGLCVFHWLLAAAALAVAGWRMSGSTGMGFFVLIQAVLHLTPLAREPGHPQEIVAVLLAASMLAALAGAERKWGLFLLGTFGAALVLTKINVGAFFGVALLSAVASQAPFRNSNKLFWFGLLVASGLALGVLFRPHLAEGWAQVYCGLAVVAIFTPHIATRVFYPGREQGSVSMIPIAAGFAVLSLLVISALLLTGTSLAAMRDDLVTGPYQLGNAFTGHLKVPAALWSAVFSFITCLATAAWRQRFNSALVWAKGLYGLVGTLLLVGDYNREVGYLWPWGWLLLAGLDRDFPGEKRFAFARVFLAFQAAWQGLQGYPTAGTQAVVATSLEMLVYSFCLWDALRTLPAARRAAQYFIHRAPRILGLVNPLVLAGLLYLFAGRWCNPISAWRYYQSVPPLELRGSNWLRLPPEQVDLYRALAHYLETECDTFITIPGANSLYFWTGKMPPTYYNASEVLLMNPAQQAEILAALQKARRPRVVIREAGGIYAFTPDAGPLGKWITQESREVGRIGNFRVLAPRESAAH